MTTALLILDGFGLREATRDNAITTAGTPFIDTLRAAYPHTMLEASGLAVGLPEGQMGNSEVGHVNIGAGRVVYQELTRITKSIADGDFFTNAALLGAIQKAKAADGVLHCIGLVSDGGVHSHMDHLLALVEMARQQGVRQTYIHAFLDGRDVPPSSGAGFLKDLSDTLQARGYGRIATVMGRYYAMDRDNRYDRVQKAYQCMVQGIGVAATDAVMAVEQSYTEGVTDEFVLPIALQQDGAPVATIRDNDAVVCFNFRPDRAREITKTFIEPDFAGFAREVWPRVQYVSLTQYDETFANLDVAFRPVGLINTLGQVLSEAGKAQLRIAETEKYAHVTFFFNGGVEEPYPGEERALIASPKVATYDLQPQMSAYDVADEAVRRVESGKYDCMILNFANADMVGHTGVFDAAVEAIRTVDACVEKVVTAVLATGGQCIITADHGNAEQLWDEANNTPYTAHTVSNPVPCILVSPHLANAKLRRGRLCDLAPTLLTMMDLAIPEQMTGECLLVGE